ncbi:MAG: GDSL-type esterase/lipase family protein [Bacteroidales bacterium]
MKKTFFFLIAFQAICSYTEAQPKKVLIFGNDITRGNEVVNRTKNRYTAQIETLSDHQIEIKTICFQDALFYMQPNITDSVMAYNPDIIIWEAGSQHEIESKGLKYKKLMREISGFHKELFKVAPDKQYIFINPTDKIEPFSEYDSFINVINSELKEKNCAFVNSGSFVPTRNPFVDKNYQPTSLGNSLIAWNVFKAIEKNDTLNSAATPVYGSEFRSSAGWREGADWHQVNEEINQRVTRNKLDLLLIGNSITQGWGGSNELVTYKPGKAAAEQNFAGLKWECAGISGDKVQHILWRIKQGVYEKSEARTIVLTLGVNNLPNDENTPQEIVEGIEACVKELSTRFPKSQIVLFGPLPANADPTSLLRQSIIETHQLLLNTSMPSNVKYIDPTSWFTMDNGALKSDLYVRDQLHLSPKGYEFWGEKIKTVLTY